MKQQVSEDKIAKLQGAISKAATLIQNESAITQIAKNKRGMINESLMDGVDVTISSMMSSRNGASVGHTTQMPQRGGRMNENVPSVIRESFMKNPIDTSGLTGLEDGRDLSFLESAHSAAAKPVMQEEIVRQTPMVNAYPQQPSAIDYPMIRTIVEEAVRKYTSQLSKKLISESRSNTIPELNTMTIGKSFKFLSNDGTIYECTMKKVGNVNHKKK